jgi:tRNA-specific 2-thiouridylase
VAEFVRGSDGVDGTVLVRLREPLRGVAPGQAVVLYRTEPEGDLVLGSATITDTQHRA